MPSRHWQMCRTSGKSLSHLWNCTCFIWVFQPQQRELNQYFTGGCYRQQLISRDWRQDQKQMRQLPWHNTIPHLHKYSLVWGIEIQSLASNIYKGPFTFWVVLPAVIMCQTESTQTTFQWQSKKSLNINEIEQASSSKTQRDKRDTYFVHKPWWCNVQRVPQMMSRTAHTVCHGVESLIHCKK